MATGRRPYHNNRKLNKPVRKLETTKMQTRPMKKRDLHYRKLKNKLGVVDFTFIFIVFVLLAFGLVMLLSASTPAANTKTGKSYYFFIRQLCGIGLGSVMLIFFTMVDYHLYKRFIPIFFWCGVIFLLLCIVPGIGEERNGAWRWLRTPLIQLQPSEFMKPLIALYFAKLVSEEHGRFERFSELKKYLIVLAIVGGIMLFVQSHLSGAIVICGIGMVIILVAGARIRYFLGLALVAVPVGYIYIMQDSMRLGRILSMIDPFRDTSGKSYQIVQSLIAIGSGGLFGKGLGQSVQKYAYLPEPYNDFIFAIVCEELGFVGAFIIMALFAALIVRGIKIALEAPDTFGMLTVIGIIAHIAIQTVFNIAVVCSAIPTTGISLPFFSFGGTAIMVLVAEIGIVLNVSRQSVKINNIPK